jgi:hypothetical protein
VFKDLQPVLAFRQCECKHTHDEGNGSAMPDSTTMSPNTAVTAPAVCRIRVPRSTENNPMNVEVADAYGDPA